LLRNQIISLGIEKNGSRSFRRPKFALSCSAEGKEGSVTDEKGNYSGIFWGFYTGIYLNEPRKSIKSGTTEITNRDFT
jgi:hypothetical protein